MLLHPTSALLLLTLLLLLPIICLLFLRQQDPKKQQPPPPADDDYMAYPLLGTLPHFLKNQHRLLPWSIVVKRSPKNTIPFTALGGLAGVVLTANPDNVEHIVKASFANFPKGDLMLSTNEDFLGHGILNSDGDQWLWQRKAASHEFHSSSRRKFIVDAVRSEVVERLLPLLELAAHEGRTVDVQAVLQRFAFDNICNMAFGHDPACLAVAGEEGAAELIRHAIEEVQNRMLDRFRMPENLLWRVKRALNLGAERQLLKSLAVMHGFVNKVVQECREAAAGPAENRRDDFLTHFAARTTELTGRRDESLRDFVTNLLVAGSEATSSALTWFFWLLSGRPDVESKIVQEIRTVRGRRLGGGGGGGAGSTALSLDELREMNYLHAAITEAMRLYPPVPLRMYSCKQGDVLPDGTFVGKGWTVVQSVYAMARLEGVWGEDCEEFRPERWLTADGAFRPESSSRYPVFHGGPRMCLGKEIAYIQMKYIASSVLERFTFRYLGGQDHPGIRLSFTLWMKGGLPMRVIKRTELGGALE